jgi:hypothetical protein
MAIPITVKEPLEVPDGTYHSKIIGVENFEGRFRPGIRVHFLLDPRHGYSGVVFGIFPQEATPKNKTGRLMLATIGECIPGKTYTWDMLTGKYCWVLVENNITDEGTFPRVRRVVYPAPNAAAVIWQKPLPTRQEPVQPAPAERTAPEDDIPF